MAPPGWSQITATGTSAAAASLRGSAEGASGWTMSATAQRPFLSQTSPELLANTPYCLSLEIEALSGTLNAKDVLYATTLPAGATLSFPACPANPAGGENGTLTTGKLHLTLQVGATPGTAGLRCGLGAAGVNVTGTLQFSRPQFELGTMPTDFLPGTAVSEFLENPAVYLQDALGKRRLSTTARTNLLPMSQTFTDAGWARTRVGVQTSAIPAPDGTATATVLSDDTTAGQHYIRRTVSGLTVGETYTVSAYLKAGTAGFAYVQLGSTYVGLNLTTGALDFRSSGAAYDLVPLPNGWWRLAVPRKAAATSEAVILGLCTSSGTYSYTGTGSTILLWGAQVERGEGPTPYIPTTTAATTRTDLTLSGGQATLAVPPAPGAVLSWLGSSPVANVAPTNWLNIPGATGATYAFPAREGDRGAQFRVVVKNGAGSTPSAAAELIMTPLAPSFSYQPSLRRLTQGLTLFPWVPQNTGGGATAWSIAPALPAGLTLDPVTGTVSGTPTALSATTTHTVTATNATGTGTATLTLAVVPAKPSIAYSPSSQTLTAGTAMTPWTPTNSGGTAESWSISPALPQGLSLDPASGALAGTPMVASPATPYTVTATNGGGTGTATLTLTVVLPPAPIIGYSPTSRVLSVGTAMAPWVPTSTGGPVQTWTVSPALPAGLSLDALTGTLSGTPTAAFAATSFTITATNPGGSTTAQVTLVAVPTAWVYYPFQEGIGTTTADQSGHGARGTLVNGPQWVDGKVGKGLQFNGTSSYVDVSAVNCFSGPFTIGAWAKFDTVNRAGTSNNIFSIGAAGTNQSIWVGEAQGKPYFGFWGNDLIGTKELQPGLWYYVTYVFTGSQKRIYVNGVLDSSQNSSAPTINNANARIGNNAYWSGNFFQGLLDEVRIYPHALSDQEIQSLFTSSINVVVAPRNVTLHLNETQVFTATVSGATQADVTWELPDAGSGTITVGGLYTAPSTIQGSSQTFRVVARSVADPVQTHVATVKVNRGLTASYAFAEGSGTTTADASGSGYHGTLVNGPLWEDGKVGKALRFNGTSQYVDVPGVNDFQGAFTISAWAKFDTVNRYGTSNPIFSLGAASTNNSIWTGEHQGKPYMGFWGNDLAGTTSLMPGIWYHLTFVFTGSQKRIYVNGVLDSSQDSTGPIISQSNARIGNNAYWDSGHFQGLLDEVRIYNRALTDAEIAAPYANTVNVVVAPRNLILLLDQSQAFTATVSGTTQTDVTWELPDAGSGTITAGGLYTAPSSVQGSSQSFRLVARSVADPTQHDSTTVKVNRGLTASYAFEEGSGTTTADASGSGYHGTLVNGSQWVDGKVGKALQFNGSGQYVDVPGVNDFQGAFTISSWVKFDTVNRSGTSNPIFYLGSAGTNNHIWTGEHQGKPYMGFYGNDFAGNTSLLPYVWYHLTFVFTGSQKRIYVNGVLDSSQNSTGPTISQSNARIGNAGSAFCQGLLDEVRIYNRALTDAEIAAPFAAVVNVIVQPRNLVLPTGASHPFTATLTGTGNSAVTWELPEADSGSITAAGVYTAPTVIPSEGVVYRVLARSVADPTSTNEALVVVRSPITLSPKNPTVAMGATQTFTSLATVKGSSDTSVTWSTTGGTISTAGLFTAPNAAGTYTITARAKADPNTSITTTVYVPVKVTIAPSTVRMAAGTQQAFVATVVGHANTAVTWTATGGTIDAQGTFTAPAEGGVYSVTATSVADPLQQATVPVTVTLDGLPDISGTWSTYTGSGRMDMALYQLGTRVVGWWYAGGSGWANTFRVEGTLNGQNIHLDFFLPSTPATINASADLTFSADLQSYTGTQSYYGSWSGYKKAGVSVLFEPLYNYIKVGSSRALFCLVGGTLDKRVVFSTADGQVSATGQYTAPDVPGYYKVKATSVADPAKSTEVNAYATLDGLPDVSGTWVTHTSYDHPDMLLFQVGTQLSGWWYAGATGWQGTYRVTGTLDGLKTKLSFFRDSGGNGTISATTDMVFAEDLKSYTWTHSLYGAQSGTRKTGISLDLDPASLNLDPGGTALLKVMLAGHPDKRVVWNLTGGSMWPMDAYTYAFTAPVQPGAYDLVALAGVDTTATATTKVLVAGNQEPQLQIAPNQVKLGKGGTATFTATVSGLANPALTWTCTGGAIDANGAYTAPMAFGTYTVTATSVSNPSLQDSATVVVSALAGTDRSFTYDLNGNMTSDGERDFEWDAENRLLAVVIKATGHRSEFAYDGLGRRVVIKELDKDAQGNLQTTSDKKYLWDGAEIAEERTGTEGGAINKRFYSQGFVDTDGTALFYTRDHLGSVRELTDNAQVVRARYEYDPYGRMTKLSGDRDSFLTYTGHVWHAQSGMNLTLFRAYDPELGRWISRDPIEEGGGINTYAYANANPIYFFDPLGLCNQKAYGECLKLARDTWQSSVNIAWEAFKAAMRNLKINYDAWTGLNDVSTVGGLASGIGAGSAWGSIPAFGGPGSIFGGGGAFYGAGAGVGATMSAPAVLAAGVALAGVLIGHSISNVWEDYKHRVFNLEMIRDLKISDADTQYDKDVRKCQKKHCCK